ncbi:MAG TPA: carboxypeptidase-like regulatory domain-containing protein, partial [Bacteroidota bacterium]|nr:carboxypeptidase-like regulatory domain-containing protein [Bacteroidota bacterium]
MRAPALILCAVAALLAPLRAQAQGLSPADRGRIEGKVVDAKSGEGLPGANVTVKGTYYGGSSDFDGNVRVERVNPGVYVVEISLLGYKTVQFTDVNVEAGKTY